VPSTDDKLITWLDQQHNALLEQVSARLLAPGGTAFRVAGDSATKQIVERILAALRADLITSGSGRLRSAVIDAIAGGVSTRLAFQDLRLIAVSLRQALLDGLEVAPDLQPAARRSVDDWLYQLALQSGLYSLAQREELIEEQASQLEIRVAELQSLYGEQSRLLELLQQISTPIAPIYTGIVVVPLVGTLDSYRAQSLTERLLEAIVQQQAEYVILDISGVPLFDTSIAQLLVQAAKAAGLLGTHVVLVGLSPEVAQTVVHLGVELDALVTKRTLQDGLAYALAKMRCQIVSTHGNQVASQ
jgi:anti-anti-sigma factor